MVTIRPATPDDESFLLSLTERLADFPLPPWRTGPEISRADDRVLLGALHQPTAGTTILVGEESGDRLGYVFASTRTDYFTGAPHAHIEILAVDRPAEGKGVARALMAAAEAWARERGYAAVTLNVFAGNRQARGLYEHLGYQAELLTYRREL